MKQLFSILVLLLCFSLVSGTPSSYNYNTCSFQKNQQWMSYYSNVLNTKTLFQITVPGTHDSGSYSLSTSPSQDSLNDYNAITGDVPSQVSVPIIQKWSKTQTQNFTQQLNAGVRYFDLRTTFTSNNFYFFHFLLADYTIDTGLSQFVNFAKSNLKEVVILNFNHLLNINSSQHLALLNKINSAFGSYLLPRSEGFNITYAALIQHSYRVVVLYEGLKRTPYYNNFTNIFDNSFVLDAYADSNNATQVLNYEVTAVNSNGGSASKGVYFYPQFILTANNDDILNSVESPLSGNQDLRDFSHEINSEFQAFYADIFKTDFRVVYVDFIEETNSLDVSKRMNMKGVIVAGSTTGAACKADADCTSGNCQTVKGFCLVDCPQANGTSCGDPTQCLAGMCTRWECGVAAGKLDNWINSLLYSIMQSLFFLF